MSTAYELEQKFRSRFSLAYAVVMIAFLLTIGLMAWFSIGFWSVVYLLASHSLVKDIRRFQ